MFTITVFARFLSDNEGKFAVPVLQDQRSAADARDQERGEVHHLHEGSTERDLSTFERLIFVDDYGC